MKKFLLLLALAGTLGGAANALPNAAEIIPTKNGAIRITPIYHASLQIEYRGKVIQVDPFSAGDYSGAKKADVVLITHTHPDHLDKKQIDRLVRREGYNFILAPLAAAKLLTRYVKYGQAGSYSVGDNINVMALDGLHRSKAIQSNVVDFELPNGKESRVAFTIRAVPAYNLKRGPKPGQKFHPKGEFNGYILTLGGKRIYIAGDTEATPEMKALKNIDIAFLPMNLPYTMTPQEAAIGAKAFKPKVVYPYHYRYPFTKANDNPQQFAKALKGSGIEVRLRGWYAHPAKK